MTKEITVSSPDGEQGGITQENLQEKLMLFQLMEKQLETLGQHKNMVETRIVEIEATKGALEEIGRLKPDNENLIPLGSGIYTRAKITDKKFLTELGASVMKDNDMEGALEFLEARKDELLRAAKQIDDQAGDISRKLNEIGPELQKMAAQIQQ